MVGIGTELDYPHGMTVGIGAEPDHPRGTMVGTGVETKEHTVGK